jgi:KDO2-lipid IV(A) lauroyltransferase
MFETLVIRLLTFPLALLPFRTIHFLGRHLGTLAYHLIPRYRKRALSNLSLAFPSMSEKELKATAKASCQNLMIVALEYPKFALCRHIDKVVICQNPHLTTHKRPIFFVGHQANWEVLFLDGSRRMPGVAIGRPIKNPHLYNWILSIREKFGGKIITPKGALKEGLRALKEGKFLGIVGDQGMPESPFSSLFFGRKAYTSPAPAILAYRTNTPLVVATIERRPGKYLIHYSDPLIPDSTLPMEAEVNRMMKEALTLLEVSIANRPGEWLWQHNRWKQESSALVYYRFRHDSILIITPHALNLSLFRELYPKAFITLLVPQGSESILDEAEVITYHAESELFRQDYRFKLVFNLTPNLKIASHYLKLSAFEALNLSPTTFEDILLSQVKRAS